MDPIAATEQYVYPTYSWRCSIPVPCTTILGWLGEWAVARNFGVNHPPHPLFIFGIRQSWALAPTFARGPIFLQWEHCCQRNPNFTLELAPTCSRDLIEESKV